jgi:hypothetical protein
VSSAIKHGGSWSLFALFTFNVRFLYISHEIAHFVIVNPRENKVIIWFLP